MLATLGGFLALLLGLAILLLPLLISELSRPRDSLWGAVVLLLGLVLVTTSDRLTGAPMLAVLCGGLLVGRLGSEVAQGRWRALSNEERAALTSSERWRRSLDQLAASSASLLQSALGVAAGASAWMAERRQPRSHGKRWVRAEDGSEPSSPQTAQPGGQSPPDPAAIPANDPAPAVEAASVSASHAAMEPSDGSTQPLPVANPGGSAPGRPAPTAAAAEQPFSEATAEAASASDADATGDSPSAQDAAAASEHSLATAADAKPSDEAGAAPDNHPDVQIVPDFAAIEALIEQAPEPAAPPSAP